MSSSVGRGQTTKGVWAAFHVETKVFILDCEGTDSKERGEERHKFEHSSSLFCLAMADVLVINMWTNVILFKIGRRSLHCIQLRSFKNCLRNELKIIPTGVFQKDFNCS